MLKREKPTLSPERFNSKSLISLLEAVTETANKEEKENKNTIKGRGGAKGSGESSTKGGGAPRPAMQTDDSPAFSKYAFGIPMAFMRTGLGMQQADFRLSQIPYGQIGGAAIIGGAMPEVLDYFSSETANLARNYSPDVNMDDIPDEYKTEILNALGFGSEKSPEVSKKAKTVTFGGREMSVKPDSFMGKVADPYGIGSFVDFAKTMGEIQKEKLKKEKQSPASPIRNPMNAPFGY
jgi:hypothetical protein